MGCPSAGALWQHSHSAARYADFGRGGRLPSEVFDILGLRVIVSAASDADVPHTSKAAACLHIEHIIARLFATIPSRRKDYITFPKENGYRSLHLAVHLSAAAGAAADNVDTVEIQVRSDEMHVAAEHGESAHSAYKGGLDRLHTSRLKDWSTELMRVRPVAGAPWCANVLVCCQCRVVATECAALAGVLCNASNAVDSALGRAAAFG